MQKLLVRICRQKYTLINTGIKSTAYFYIGPESVVNHNKFTEMSSKYCLKTK